MSRNKVRISIIGMLLAVAVASFGCGGGGGSGVNPAAGGDFITAVIPGSESANKTESGDAILGGPPTLEGEENETGDSTQNTQTAQQTTQNGNQEEDREEEPGNSTDPKSRNEDENTPVNPVHEPVIYSFLLPKYFDYSKILQGYFPLPPGHDLEQGQIKIGRSFSRQFGRTIITCPGERHGWCVVNIDENGVATYDENEIIPSFTPEFTLLPRSVDSAQAPVLDFVNVLHVGANVAPRSDELTEAGDRNGVGVSSGGVQDGIGSERLLEFMGHHVRPEDKHKYSGVNKGSGLETFFEPPTIRLAEGTSELYARYAAHAVQLINSALPYDKRIRLSTETLPVGTNLNDVPEGEIRLRFASKNVFGSLANSILGSASNIVSTQFNSETQRDEIQRALKAGVAINEHLMRDARRYSPEQDGDKGGTFWKLTSVANRQVENSDTLIKMFNDHMFVTVLVHELMHALGFFHVKKLRFPDSVLNAGILSNKGHVRVHTPYLKGPTFYLTVTLQSKTSETTNHSGAITTVYSETETTDQSDVRQTRGSLATPRAGTMPGHILFPIDRAALLAAYGRFAPGTQPEELTAENLGDWSDTSFHLRGDMGLPVGQASFGVASSNGLAQPWATGPAPWTDLADSQELSGSVTWNGALLGVDSSSETVAGDAGLTVDLSSLTGRIDFTGLEKWGAGEAPGETGSGEMWGDGDLGYTVEVHGNTFIQTGGDEGQVTGAFFGAAHEAMGGVLERADLSAGFGGKR